MFGFEPARVGCKVWLCAVPRSVAVHRIAAHVPAAGSVEAAYASLLSELCVEVGVGQLSQLLPTVRQLCAGTLMLPALTAFADAVRSKLSKLCGIVHPYSSCEVDAL